MRVQGHEGPNGRAKVTRGHNLPAAHVIHTVGPAVRGIVPTARDRADLAACSRSCLELADGRCLREGEGGADILGKVRVLEEGRVIPTGPSALAMQPMHTELRSRHCTSRQCGATIRL